MEPNLSFEEALKTLESIVKELESGNLSLEDSVTKYQEGILLAKRCHDLLKKAESVVVQLVENEGLTDFPKPEE
jgi:exodeoxyribonuclease VII small subunit